MNVAEAIAATLVDEGVTLAAGMGGQSIGPLMDAVADCMEISLMYVRQERVAFDVCDGFARSSGRPAICFTDAGPAAANLMGGLVNSWGDSVPVMFFAGHNKATEVASRYSKELPFLDLFGPVSKWAALIDDPVKAAEIMRRGFMHLRTGRPGPVIIGMPVDVSQMDVGNYNYQTVGSQRRARSGGDPEALREAVEMIAGAERPYVYTGAGILQSEATDELVKFAELLSLPVGTTLNGKSGMPEDHPLALGIGGFAKALYGSLPATKMGREADVILTIGCGFKHHATIGRPEDRVKHIQIDVDPTELNRDHMADVAILADARIVLQQMCDVAGEILPKKRLARIDARYDEIAELKGRWAEVSARVLESDEVPINPFRVTNELIKLVDPARTIVIHDAGTVRGSTCQHYLATTPRGFLGFGVESAMGWSIGAAMGAKKANPDKLVIAVIGEEAMCETALDIETSIRNEAPILVIVKNNRRKFDHDMTESERLAYHRFHQGISPSGLAAALGAGAYLAERPDEIAGQLAAAIKEVQGGHTAVFEAMTNRINTSLHGLWDS